MYDHVNLDWTINMSHPAASDSALCAAPARSAWVGAAEAARLLGVTRATLYAYVSRSLVRSQVLPGSARERGYARDDIERLRRRTEERRAPDKAAARALQWGLPILESSIALIDGYHLYYRGHDAVQLAREQPVGAVAALIWRGALDAALPAPAPGHVADPGAALSFQARAQVMLARAAADDALALDLRPASVARCGGRVLQLLVRAAAGARTQAATIDGALASAWGVGPRGADMLRAAIILCADLELNVSTFTARCVASANATPYAAVLAGLAALGGARHGGISARVESMLAALRGERDLRSALAARLQRGESIDGFGHRLYRHGDPRATALLEWLGDGYGRAPELAFVRTVARAAGQITGEAPNIDFALAAMARVLRLPAGAPFTLFAIGRTIGWIGHAIEQYATAELIRPRAKYVGVVPATE
jgi:citrate synthase